MIWPCFHYEVNISQWKHATKLDLQLFKYQTAEEISEVFFTYVLFLLFQVINFLQQQLRP